MTTNFLLEKCLIGHQITQHYGISEFFFVHHQFPQKKCTNFHVFFPLKMGGKAIRKLLFFFGLPPCNFFCSHKKFRVLQSYLGGFTQKISICRHVFVYWNWNSSLILWSSSRAAEFVIAVCFVDEVVPNILPKHTIKQYWFCICSLVVNFISPSLQCKGFSLVIEYNVQGIA